MLRLGKRCFCRVESSSAGSGFRLILYEVDEVSAGIFCICDAYIVDDVLVLSTSMCQEGNM